MAGNGEKQENPNSPQENNNQVFDIDKNHELLIQQTQKLAEIIGTFSEKAKIEMLRTMEDLMISFFDEIHNGINYLKKQFEKNEVEIEQFKTKLTEIYNTKMKQLFILIDKIQKILEENNLMQYRDGAYDIVNTLKKSLESYYQSLIDKDDSNFEDNYIETKNELINKRNIILNQKILSI